MYQPSTQFPQITNRESWTQLIGVYDAETGDPINLTNTQGQGTFSSWSVAVSSTIYGPTLFSTTSQSTLTISNGIQGAALPTITLNLEPNWYLTQTSVVGNELNIVPGNFVTFTATADNTKWMTGVVNSYDPATGVLIFTVVTVSIELEIRRVQRNGSDYRDSGYGANYSLGSYDWGAPILSASVGNGITIVDLGIFQVYFSETQFRSLGSGMHSVAATLASADGVDTRQLFLGRLPVLSGMVTN